MDNLEKQLKLLSALDANKLLVKDAARIEFKRTKSGHYRLWMGFPEGVPEANLEPVKTLVNGAGVSMNPFGKKGLITAVTFVDDNEDE